MKSGTCDADDFSFSAAPQMSQGSEGLSGSFSALPPSSLFNHSSFRSQSAAQVRAFIQGSLHQLEMFVDAMVSTRGLPVRGPLPRFPAGDRLSACRSLK